MRVIERLTAAEIELHSSPWICPLRPPQPRAATSKDFIERARRSLGPFTSSQQRTSDKVLAFIVPAWTITVYQASTHPRVLELLTDCLQRHDKRERPRR